MTTDGGQWAVGSGGFGAPVPTGWAYAPSAPQPGTVPLRPLDSGDIMRGVLTTMPRYARPLYLPLLAFALGFTVLLSGCALAAWTLITPLPAPGTRTTTPHLLEMAEVIGIAALPLLIYATVAYAATATVSTTVLGHYAVLGRPRPIASRAWAEGRRHLWRVLGTQLLISLTTGAILLASTLAGHPARHHPAQHDRRGLQLAPAHPRSARRPLCRRTAPPRRTGDGPGEQAPGRRDAPVLDAQPRNLVAWCRRCVPGPDDRLRSNPVDHYRGGNDRDTARPVGCARRHPERSVVPAVGVRLDPSGHRRRTRRRDRRDAQGTADPPHPRPAVHRPAHPAGEPPHRPFRSIGRHGRPRGRPGPSLRFAGTNLSGGVTARSYAQTGPERRGLNRVGQSRDRGPPLRQTRCLLHRTLFGPE